MAQVQMITSDDVIAALGQNPDLLGDATDAITSAIARATIKLEAILRTSFVKQQVTDTFLIKTHVGVSINGWYRMLLSNGCLRDAPVTVSTSDRFYGTYTPETSFMVNKLNGLLQLSMYESSLTGWLPQDRFRSSQPEGERYVKVSYQSGFVSGDTYPDELKQALISYTPLLMFSSREATAEGDKASQSGKGRPTIDSIGNEMLNLYSRRIGACMRPTISEAVAL